MEECPFDLCKTQRSGGPFTFCLRCQFLQGLASTVQAVNQGAELPRCLRAHTERPGLFGQSPSCHRQPE